jgi:hypothetical protein
MIKPVKEYRLMRGSFRGVSRASIILLRIWLTRAKDIILDDEIR